MNQPIGKVMMALATSILLFVTGCSAGGGQQKEVELLDVHGIGYTADGKQLYVAAHDGFRVYTNGHWEVPNLPKNDYMGYQATRPRTTGFTVVGTRAPPPE